MDRHYYCAAIREEDDSLPKPPPNFRKIKLEPADDSYKSHSAQTVKTSESMLRRLTLTNNDVQGPHDENPRLRELFDRYEDADHLAIQKSAGTPDAEDSAPDASAGSGLNPPLMNLADVGDAPMDPPQGHGHPDLDLDAAPLDGPEALAAQPVALPNFFPYGQATLDALRRFPIGFPPFGLLPRYPYLQNFPPQFPGFTNPNIQRMPVSGASGPPQIGIFNNPNMQRMPVASGPHQIGYFNTPRMPVGADLGPGQQGHPQIGNQMNQQLNKRAPPSEPPKRRRGGRPKKNSPLFEMTKEAKEKLILEQQKKIEELEEACQSSQDEAAIFKSSWRNSETARAEANQRIQNLEGLLKHHNVQGSIREVERLTNESKYLNTRVNTLMEKCESAVKGHREASQQVVGLENQLREANVEGKNREIESLRLESARWNGAAQHLNQKYQEAEQARAAAFQRVAYLEKHVADLKASNQTAFDQQNTSISQLNEELKDKNSKIDALQKDRETLEKKLSTHDGEKEEWITKEAAWNKEKVDLTLALEKHQLEKAAELKKLKDDHTKKLGDMVAVHQLSMDQFVEDIDQETAQKLEGAKNQHKTEIEKLQAQLDGWSQRWENAQRAMKDPFAGEPVKVESSPNEDTEEEHAEGKMAPRKRNSDANDHFDEEIKLKTPKSE